MAKPKRRSSAKPASAARDRAPAKSRIERAPALVGWLSSDVEEIERRRWRGKTEISHIERLEPDRPFFGSFRVGSSGGGGYEVEIRSLDRPINSCGCADHRVNGLGTCKHIEGVLAQLRRRGARAFAAALRQGSPRAELFLPRAGDARPLLLWPADENAAAAARHVLAPLLTAEGNLADVSADGIHMLLSVLERADSAARDQIRVSRAIPAWLADARRRTARIEARAAFLAEVAAGRQTLDVLKHPLLPYQRDGMLHLAFGERALLADDMGLGKTIQAIAAAELLRRLKGVARVLVVCPASLKGEWQDQIARFSDASTLLVAGLRPARLQQYSEPAFFTLVNYEQVVIDAAEINRLVKPDIVILDEAQRIKNWQTKTARVVKSLAAPYAFVLTGTPVENRIDEIYSIVQYLDPELLGPLFRFNREFYALDERGRPIGCRNLDELTRRLKPVMLRRKKSDVETELPGRTVANYFVDMADEQRARYDDYKSQAARLLQIARRRPLAPKEFDRLQMLLSCMRMLCDTPFILDPNCRVSPKIEELERVLGELLADPERKVIVFSEWERMLTLVRELVSDMGIEFAWHTGSTPQERRRGEIARFKRDPGCRLFLSTDSGSVGLNLQAASAVINLDLPWNPAKLEQRIARAWRKNQRRTVDVINFVTEGSIEHSMLHVLAQKQALADGLLDGRDNLKAMTLPSGRSAFVERMAAALEPPVAPAAAPTAPATPERSLRDDLVKRHGEALLLVETHRGADGGEVLLAVLEDGARAAAERERLANDGVGKVEVLDRNTYETIQRLTGVGVLQASSNPARELFRAPSLAASVAERERELLAKSAEILGGAERKLRMALLLAQGGFAAEATPILSEALEIAAEARKLMAGAEPLDESAAPTPPSTVTEPAAPRPLDELAGSLERMLGDIRRNFLPAAQAA